MRHLIGLALALVAAGAVFVGAGWSVTRILAAHAHGTSLVSLSGGLTLAALVGTGLYLGILVSVQALSPIGAGLPGLILLGWTALDVFSAHWALRLIPLTGYETGSGFRSMLTTGVLALLGAVMVIPLFVPARWRQRESKDEFADMTRADLVH